MTEVTLGDFAFDPVEPSDFRLALEGASKTGKSNSLAVFLEDLAVVREKLLPQLGATVGDVFELLEMLGVVVGVVGHSRREEEGEGESGTISIATARPPVQINRCSFRARLCNQFLNGVLVRRNTDWAQHALSAKQKSRPAGLSARSAASRRNVLRCHVGSLPSPARSCRSFLSSVAGRFDAAFVLLLLLGNDDHLVLATQERLHDAGHEGLKLRVPTQPRFHHDHREILTSPLNESRGFFLAEKTFCFTGPASIIRVLKGQRRTEVLRVLRRH